MAIFGIRALTSVCWVNTHTEKNSLRFHRLKFIQLKIHAISAA